MADFELKPCPFCGGEAVAYTQGGRYGLFAWLECDFCGAKTKTVTSELSANNPEFQESSVMRRLSIAWNRRCDDA